MAYEPFVYYRKRKYIWDCKDLYFSDMNIAFHNNDF